MRKKIAMLGAFAVGKTSVVRRFVNGIFSERYLTTVGVKIDKKEVDLGDRSVTLILWDIHGEDEFQKIRSSYLRGSAGYFLVVDVTRRNTLDVALQLQSTAQQVLGDVPHTLLVNKTDLEDDRDIEPEALERLRTAGWTIVETSAKTGDAVEDAFLDLARRMVDG